MKDQETLALAKARESPNLEKLNGMVEAGQTCRTCSDFAICGGVLGSNCVDWHPVGTIKVVDEVPA